jgi:transcriptional regulator with XRE-family HTH domain
MADTQRPTIRSRRLGMQLRALREERGLTLKAAARLLNRTPSAISKLETGHRGIYRPSLENMLDRYQVTDEEHRERLFALARDSGKKGWWRAYDNALLPSTTDLISLEDDATEIRRFDVSYVPGLLQTEAYTRAMLLGGIAPPSLGDVDRIVSIRVKTTMRVIEARETARRQLQNRIPGLRPKSAD